MVKDALNMSQLIEGIAEGLCVCTKTRDYPYVKFTVWNKKLIDITGYTMEEINEKGLYTALFVHPEDKEKVFQWLEKMYKGEQTKDDEWEIVRKDGQRRILSTSTSVIMDESGEIHVLALIRDITKLKQLEVEYEEIHERFKTLFELTPIAVLIHGKGKIMFSNSAGVELLGAKSAEDLRGLPMLQFVHEDYHDIVTQRINDIEMGTKYTPLMEQRFVKLNGTVIDVEVAAASMPFEGQVYNLVFIRDITSRKAMENSLRESEALLRQITENTMDMIVLCDIQGRIKYITPSHKDIIGYETDSMLGKSVFDFVHPDERQYILEVFESTMSEHWEGNIQYQCRHSDGHFVWLEIAGKSLYDVNRKVQDVIFSARDITTRVRTEEALRKSEKKFRDLFNNINDAVFMHRLPGTGRESRFIEVNDVACRRMGYTREELCSINPFAINPTLTENMVCEAVRELMEKGSITLQTINVTKEGKIIPVEVNSILFDFHGERVILSIVSDITERLKNERSLRESEERYRLLVEMLPYAVFIRTDEKVLFTNKMGLKYFDFSSSEDMVNKPILELIAPHPTYAGQFKLNLEILKRDGYLPLSEEKFIRLKDNHVLDFETVATRFSHEGEDAVLVVARDITERKQVQELQKNMEEKTRLLNQAFEYEKLRTEFFANISHELRTPINVILSALQLFNLKMDSLIEHKGMDKLKKHTSVMKQNCYRLIRLINNLIDVTKIDSGYFQMNLSNNNIISIIEDITLSVAEYIENKGISLTFDTDVEEKTLACDPDKIERIMLNLISNSVKYTEPGGSILVNASDKGDKLLVSVKDTGIGIPEEKQQHIFERFVQVHESLVKASEGSGIGLSLVKSLVEMHKGNISLKSEYGKGSEFIIELPVLEVESCGAEVNRKDWSIQGNIEKINVEFSDIYF
jgi:PAS domain S-box-containing protein